MEEIAVRTPPYICEPLVRTNLDEEKHDWAWLLLPEGWRKVPGNVRLCVIDTRFDMDHPDFDGQVEEMKDFTSSRGRLRADHGTWCASCAAGVAENGFAVGVAPGARLCLAPALEDSGGGTTRQIASAIRWAADMKCRVVSMSLGTLVESREMTEAINDYYSEVPDGIVVAAAGNDGARRGHPVGYPAKLENVIAVGAMNKKGQRSAFSSWGDEHVDIVGPGEDVIAAIPMEDGGLGRMSGTSMATPFVAGAACLWAELNPGKGRAAFRKALKETARDIGKPGYDPETGWGLINPVDLQGDAPSSTPGKTYKILSGEFTAVG